MMNEQNIAAVFWTVVFVIILTLVSFADEAKKETVLTGYTCTIILRYTIDSAESSGVEKISLLVESTPDHTPTYMLAGEMRKPPVRLPVTGYMHEGDKVVIHAAEHKLTLPQVRGEWDVWATLSVRRSIESGTLYAHGLADNGRFVLTGVCKANN